jgi:anti-sigma B factor antagonist
VSARSIQPSRHSGLEHVQDRSGFYVGRHRVPGGIRVALTGELDLTGVPAATDQLRRAQSESQEVLLDLSELSFMDASGLYMIVAADTRARHHHDRLRILCGRSRVRRLFERTGTDHSLEPTDAGIAGTPATPDDTRQSSVS